MAKQLEIDLSGLLPHQRKLITSDSKQSILICGRGAGKSYACDGKHVTCSEGQRFDKRTIDEAEHHSCSCYSYCYFSREHEPMEFMIWLRCNYPKVIEEYNEYKRIITGPTKDDVHYEVTYDTYGLRKTEDRIYVHYPEAVDRAIELSKNHVNTNITINRCWHDALTNKDCAEQVYWLRGGFF